MILQFRENVKSKCCFYDTSTGTYGTKALFQKRTPILILKKSKYSGNNKISYIVKLVSFWPIFLVNQNV
jgi:hypothetical protein